MHFIAKLKSWQVFLVLISTMILPALVFELELSRVLRVLFLLLNMSIYLLWVHAIGVVSNDFVNDTYKRNYKGNIYTGIYSITFVAAMLLFIERLPSNIFVVLPFHIIAMGCLVFNVGTAAKSLVSAVNNRNAGFSEYSSTIFKIWIYPIGIWKVQKQLNSLVARSQ